MTRGQEARTDMAGINTQLTVGEVALPLENMALLKPTSVLRESVELMSQKRLGIACILDDNGLLIGVFTDGDIRRVLLSTHKPIAALFAGDVSEFMTESPKTVAATVTLADAVSMMEAVDVYDLPMVDDDGRCTGLLHMHTALHYLLSL
jgi:arabinose-5-phosphate isomerase